MDKKIITTLRLHRCLGLTCSDCPLKGQGMNQKQFCSFYKKSHDEARPKFCKVENIEITEGLELPEPREYDRNFNPILPMVTREEIEAFAHKMGRACKGLDDKAPDYMLSDWLESKGIKIRK